MEKKMCKTCKEVKEINEFSKQRNACRDCRNAYYSQYGKDVRKLGNSMRERNLLNRMKAYKKYVNTPDGKEKKLATAKRQYLKHALKAKARNIVNGAIKLGKIIKGECAYIQGHCKGRIEGHHWNYNKPLDVVWFCEKHHRLADNVQKLINNTL